MTGAAMTHLSQQTTSADPRARAARSAIRLLAEVGLVVSLTACSALPDEAGSPRSTLRSTPVPPEATVCGIVSALRIGEVLDQGVDSYYYSNTVWSSGYITYDCKIELSEEQYGQVRAEYRSARGELDGRREDLDDVARAAQFAWSTTSTIASPVILSAIAPDYKPDSTAQDAEYTQSRLEALAYADAGNHGILPEGSMDPGYFKRTKHSNDKSNSDVGRGGVMRLLTEARREWWSPGRPPGTFCAVCSSLCRVGVAVVCVMGLLSGCHAGEERGTSPTTVPPTPISDNAVCDLMSTDELTDILGFDVYYYSYLHLQTTSESSSGRSGYTLYCYIKSDGSLYGLLNVRCDPSPTIYSNDGVPDKMTFEEIPGTFEGAEPLSFEGHEGEGWEWSENNGTYIAWMYPDGQMLFVRLTSWDDQQASPERREQLRTLVAQILLDRVPAVAKGPKGKGSFPSPTPSPSPTS